MKIKVYTKEIKYRLLFILLSSILNTIIILHYKEELLFLLGQHQKKEFPHFISTNLPEIFFCYIKLSIFMGLYFNFPVIITHLWLFLVPAIYQFEYNKTKKFITLSILLYILGTTLIYTIFLPYCWAFFSSFELNYEKNGINLFLETRLQDYIDFFTRIFLSTNITINFSLFLSFFLSKFPITNLIKLRKLIYFFSFLIATLLTPPDINSQIITGITLCTIYEIFIIYSYLIHEYKKRANNGT